MVSFLIVGVCLCLFVLVYACLCLFVLVYRQGINFDLTPDGAKALELCEKGRSVARNNIYERSAYGCTF